MATDVQHPPSERAVHGNGHSKARIAAIVATLVVAVVGAAVVFTQVGNDEPTAESVTATLRVDGQPNGLAVGSDALWVALNDEPTGLGAKLERINLTSGAVEQSVPITGVLNETRRTGTSLWTERIGDWMDTKPGELKIGRAHV